jgi:signal transduction histidine kinase
VSVTVDYREENLGLAVRDDGRSVAADADAGHGLLGMRERVSVFGGELWAWPRREGGFELLATLPLESARGETASAGA